MDKAKFPAGHTGLFVARVAALVKRHGCVRAADVTREFGCSWMEADLCLKLLLSWEQLGYCRGWYWRRPTSWNSE
ncbi:MAG: hypothetical protein ACREFQ_15315 [Stellaceae bacterium]